MIDLDRISKLTGFVDKLIQLKGIEDALDEEKISELIQDAGYKVFILLTGTIESLRRQTQERVEEGFIGIDMSANKTGGQRVGVGLDNKPICAMSMTSRVSFPYAWRES